MKPPKALELDGRTGEGGGQLVRIACALAAVTSQPIRIRHVRGNRPGPRGGGLKSQHVTAIQWLAGATSATVSGLEVGSHTLEFRPALPPPQALLPLSQEQQQRRRIISIEADSGAASAILIFQAVFPFLLFAGSGSNQEEQEQEQEHEEQEEPIELSIHGGTNVSFSPSYEYLDQVLLPALQSHFGIRVERRLARRRWSQGSPSSERKGTIWFRFRPLRPGQTLKLSSSSPLARPLPPPPPPTERRTAHEITRIDATILAPTAVLAPLENAVTRNLEAGSLFRAEVQFVAAEDSGHDARLYVLLVAVSETETGELRWGRDWLYDRSVKRKRPEQLADEIARRVCGDLEREIGGDGGCSGVVDEYLQDQLVVFQALAEGRTSFPRSSGLVGDGEEGESEDLEPAMERLEIGGGETGEEGDGKGREMEGEERRMRRDKTHEPFGDGSTHTRTARWVASELLPAAQWFNRGSICEGVGLSFK